MTQRIGAQSYGFPQTWLGRVVGGLLAAALLVSAFFFLFIFLLVLGVLILAVLLRLLFSTGYHTQGNTRREYQAGLIESEGETGEMPVLWQKNEEAIETGRGLTRKS